MARVNVKIRPRVRFLPRRGKLRAVCDTLVVVRPGTGVLFAKNSDRDPNEAQLLEWHPRRASPPGARLRCSWIEIPDVAESWAVLLSRPFWMWGAEIGTNEHGVTIGNEAVFTDQPYAREGLTGMDLLRLALERARTAAEAVGVITSLLETHGQGGGCGHEDRRFTYHNSFLVADAVEAFVLETAGRRWATERVASGARSISNGLTIPGFAERHADPVKTWGAGAETRRCRTRALAAGVAAPRDLAALLRDHGQATGAGGPRYGWMRGALSGPCAHAGGLVVSTQTTASWIADLGPKGARHWATGTAAPCTGLFKPVAVGAPVAGIGAPADVADATSLWWRHERLHRAVARDPERLLALYAAERDAAEARWFDAPPAPSDAFAEADALLHVWTERVLAEAARGGDTRAPWARRYWRKRERRASLH